MRPNRAFAATAALLLAVATLGTGVANAKDAEVVKTKVTYEVTDGVITPEIEDPGMLNFGECHDGTQRLYTLWDGTNRQDWTFTYTPSQQAFEDGLPGAAMTMDLKFTFNGLFTADASRPIYELKSQGGIKNALEAIVNEDGTVTQLVSWRFFGEWFDTMTGESTGDYFAMDFTDTYLVSDGVEELISWTGSDGGTCYLHDRN